MNGKNVKKNNKINTMNEFTRMQLLAGLITEAEAAHPSQYKAPEGSDRDEKLDKAKELLKKGDKEAAYNLRDKMEKDARSKPDFKNKPRKDSKVDEAKKKASKNLSKETEAKIRAVATKKGYSFADLKREYVKGLGAFYSSGSRPGMTAHQWAMARVNSASPSKSWANVKKVNEQKKMKISEFRKLIPEEIKRTLKEESNTNDATKGSQLNEINLNQDQEKLLKDLYSVIKNYYSTLSNPQVVGTIDQLKDLYI